MIIENLDSYIKVMERNHLIDEMTSYDAKVKAFDRHYIK